MSARATAAGAACAALAALLLLASCGPATRPEIVPGADAGRGHDLIVRYGCGACHTIGGDTGADGRVGPPLTGFRQDRFIAGSLPNTPAQVVRWIENPQAILPGTIMPDLGVTHQQAKDIADYLYGQ
jgi:cytochrome c